MQKFVGKKIAIKGGGDSGRVVAELLTRLGPKEAYGNSIVQLGGPASITWYGVDFEDRDSYCATNRGRYSPLSSFIANRKEEINGARPIRPIPQRAMAVEETTYGSVRVTSSDDGYRYFDYVIDATGLTNDVTRAFGYILGIQPVMEDIDGIGEGQIGTRLEYSNVYFGGPATGGKLTNTEREAFAQGIKENAVAVWANAPRVQLLSRILAAKLTPVK
jgi:hypothetical protein